MNGLTTLSQGCQGFYKKVKWLHAVPSYKEHLYKERLVNSLEYKEQRLVSFQIVKEHVLQVA